MTLALSDFRLETAAFEVRYDFALLHWDRAGALWTQARAEWPTLKPVVGEPNKTVFRLGDEYQFMVMPEQANISGAFLNAGAAPSDDVMTNFARTATAFTAMVLTHLGVVEFTRVGFRMTYVREHKDIDAATAEILSLCNVKLSGSSFFGIDAGAPKKPRWMLRWEGKNAGISVRAEADQRSFSLDLPFGAPPMPQVPKVQERYVAFVDTDYYTLGTVPVGALNVAEWIERIHRLIRRDGLNFVRVTQ